MKVRAIDQSKKANVRSTPRNEIERPSQIETVIEPLPVNCTVKDTSRGVDFEKEFIRVLAENGVGRSVYVGPTTLVISPPISEKQ